MWYVIPNLIMGGIVTIAIIVAILVNSKQNKKHDCVNCKHLKIKYKRKPIYRYKYYCKKWSGFNRRPEYCNLFEPIYNFESCVGCHHLCNNSDGSVECKHGFERVCFNGGFELKNSEIISSNGGQQ